MAGGVVHDFNNALSVILGFSEMALDAAKEGRGTNIVEDLEHILTAAKDGAGMVTRLREFYRPDTNDEVRLPVDLNSLLEQAVTSTRPRWNNQQLSNGSIISIRTDFQAIPLIGGEAGELRQALINLLFNAVDAMPNGGEIGRFAISSG
jgi:signal transduction histidine kinase